MVKIIGFTLCFRAAGRIETDAQSRRPDHGGTWQNQRQTYAPAKPELSFLSIPLGEAREDRTTKYREGR